ncbi:unnamed protein product [Spirodela intermedia]|uniref:Chloride channel protein n=1 Tax=Spirodela intermedia TaxID=51605 RepID=A0A7I8JJA5_SPIIN|nr:unnamed protein product [Spirodela intermedia]CAA6669951.1 unnamed protein product [Spirodela intermedia]
MGLVHHVLPLHLGGGGRWIIPRAPIYAKLQAAPPPDGGGGGGGSTRFLLLFRTRSSAFSSDGRVRGESNRPGIGRGDSLLPDAPASLPGISEGTPETTEVTGSDEDGGGGGGEGGGLEEEDGVGRELGSGGVAGAGEESLPFRDFNIVAACAIGLLTGVSVVVFNNAIFFGTAYLPKALHGCERSPSEIWQRVILVPVCGGVLVSLLNNIRSNMLDEQSGGGNLSSVKGVVGPFLKAVAAAITLGTGNSLGPEGPSVEIGASIARGVGSVFGNGSGKSLSLVAAGSAAGISSGFNAAVGGCFFAVESVLWPSAGESSSSVTNTTSVVILSAVIASVISEVGLGSDPAFTVPEYDFRSPSELPLYLLLGILCGLVSVALSKCTSYALAVADYVHKTTRVPKAIFPAFGGLGVGLLALAYPEVLYWGFENVDVLLESRPFVVGLPAEILLQLIGVKIVSTSLSRASGLVGGYYAPSLFIGAATGMAYGKLIGSALSGTNPLLQLHIFEVASPQAYGLVGMAATLAGVCQVPLTAVLLLFELTHDYRIVLPLLGAVGLSSLISSVKNRKITLGNRSEPMKVEPVGNGQQPSGSSVGRQSPSSDSPMSDLCELESSLCVYESEAKTLAEKLTVFEAMRTTYVSVLMSMPLLDAVNLMFIGKQPCALIVDEENRLVGLLTLEDVTRAAGSQGKQSPESLLVSDFCYSESRRCLVQAVTPSMNLLSAEKIMDLQGVTRLPVVSERILGESRGGRAVGLLDRECIEVTCRIELDNWTPICLASSPAGGGGSPPYS